MLSFIGWAEWWITPILLPHLIPQPHSSIAHLGLGNKFLRRPGVTETWLNVLIYLQSDIKPGVKGINGSICRYMVPRWWEASSRWTLLSALLLSILCSCARLNQPETSFCPSNNTERGLGVRSNMKSFMTLSIWSVVMLTELLGQDLINIHSGSGFA